MYVVNSYLHVLKNVDSSWGNSTTSTNSRRGKRTQGQKRSGNSSHSFSQSSCKSRQTYSSSSESGLYSEELVNSGYYGDDEVDRCPCVKCASEAVASKPKTDIVAEYDIISVDLSESTTPKFPLSCDPPLKQSHFDDYVIIPSSKEEFVANTLKAPSTPLPEKNSHEFDASMESPAVTQVTVSLVATLSLRYPCKLLEEDGSDCSFTRTVALQRVASENDGTSWWRENIVWQLQQRNDTQTKRFLQLQTDSPKCRARVGINRELADYLNKYPDFRPQAETKCNNVMINMEVDPIERSELFLAMRNQRSPSGDTEGHPRSRSDSIAYLAATYIKRKRTATEGKLTESKASYSPACARSRISNRAGKRERIPGKKWRESVVNQLEMRNLLEFKYFTDTLVRRAMSQLSISENFPQPMRGVDEYDIITDDEVNSLDSRSTLINSTHSTSQSQGYYSSTFSSRFFNFKRGKRR